VDSKTTPARDLPADIDFGRVPANRHFGFSLLSLRRGSAEVAMPLKRSFLQEERVVHGGVLTTLADTAAVYTLYPFLEGGQGMTSVEFKMNFLRPVNIDDGSVTAKASLVRQGRSLAVCRVDVFQARRMVATGLFTYLIYARDDDGS
jgi:uncharacterized protein (TIGR00369 family)